MPIIKRINKQFYTEDLDAFKKDEVLVKIKLDKNDDFSFSLPLDFISVFSNAEIDMEDHIEFKYRFKEEHIVFSDLKKFNEIIDAVNNKYKELKSKEVTQKVIVLNVNLLASKDGNRLSRTSDFGWSDKMDTSLGFEYDMGLQIGSVVYKVLGTKESLLEESGEWETLGQMDLRNHSSDKEKPTSIIIPYTKERALFLKNFSEELVSLIFRMDSFIEGFGSQMFLNMIDNSEMQTLLAAPSKPIEYIIDAEITE